MGNKIKHQLEEYSSFFGEKEKTVQELKPDELIDNNEYYIEEKDVYKYSLDDIIDAVCNYYDIQRNDIKQKIRVNRL